MLKVKNLTKYYGDETVLDKISFNIERGNKIALTGFNGIGKTTLLHILAGEETYSNGYIDVQKGTTIGFLPQDPREHNEKTVREFLKEEVEKGDAEADDKFFRKVEVMFAGFLVPPLKEVGDKKIGDLSSGQKTKVFLTSILLKDFDLLLLDEPTNNLDLPALIWLEDFLQKTKAACLIVSHDRVFLDRIAEKVFEIDWFDHTLHVLHAKYSDYLIEKERERKKQLDTHVAQKEEIGRLKKIAQNYQERGEKGVKYIAPDNNKIAQGNKRNRAAKSFHRAKVTYNRIKRIDVVKKPEERVDLSMYIESDIVSGSQNILLKDAICGYNDNFPFSIGPLTLDIPFKKRVCFLGANGTGKSTILKTITGTLAPLAGERMVDQGVRFGNVMQEHESLPKEKSPFEFLFFHVPAPKELIYNHLVSFGFSDAEIDNPIEYLSPGGRARLLFAYFSAVRINVLILDEPTNHLDREASAALEASLKEFEGTVITVTHDRTFAEEVPFDALYVVSEKGIEQIADFKTYVTEMEKRSKKLLQMIK